MSTRFFVRLELHGAGDDDYTKLHNEMKKRGFKRTINDDEKTLPTGCYIRKSGSGCDSRSAALEKAKEAAKAVGREAEIVVVKTEEGLKFSGLEDA